MIKQSMKLGVDFLPIMEGKWRKSVKKRNHMTKYDNERVFPRATLSKRTLCVDGNDLYLTVQHRSCITIEYLKCGQSTEEPTSKFYLVIIN